MIEVNNLYKKYSGNDYYSVKGVSFTVEQNTICGLLGQNGAGKSTTMNMLATIFKPDQGSIKINGYDTVKERDQVKKSIGVIFETPRLYDQLTGEENILYFTKLFRMSNNDVLPRLNEMYQELEVDFQKQQVHTYSKGMKQKISVIRALITDPKVILMDEPTSGLDIMARNLIRSYIARLKNSGKTIIMSSHIAEDIEALCDKVIIMNKGEICESDNIDNLKLKYSAKNFEEVFISSIEKKKVG